MMPLLMCPNCNASMQELTRSEVTFDMCPACRGVWLDRGELEKIIEGARIPAAAASAPAQQHAQPHPSYRGGDDDDRRREHGQYQSGYKKKRGFDIFDIFD